MSKLIDRSLNAQQLFTKGNIDYDDYVLIRDNCKKSLNNYAKCLQEEALNLATGRFSANQQYVLLNHIGDIYELSDINIKQKIVNLFFPKKAVILDKDISEMMLEPIRTIFGLNKPKTIQNHRKGEDENEEAIHFLKEIIFINLENIYEKL